MAIVPPLSNGIDVKDKIREIIEGTNDAIDVAIKLSLYCMKMQIFLYGNKRASFIFAKHYLISHGGVFWLFLKKKFRNLKICL